MKMKSVYLLFLTLAFIAAAFKVQARELIIGISPYLSEAEHKQITKDLIHSIVTLEGGDKAVILDAYHMTRITEFVIPEDKRYRHPKARLQKNAHAVAALMNLPKSISNSSARPSIAGAIHLPKFVRYVAQNYPASTEKDVIVIGSPFFDSPNDQEFSMAGGLVPGDGHIRASRAKSLYGTADMQAALKDTRIHFVLAGDRTMKNDMHEYYVSRFWNLYVLAMQGQLVSFSHHDLKTVFSGVKNALKPLPNNFKLEDTDRLEMIRVRKIELRSSIYERPLSTKPFPAQRLRRASQVEIGLSWDCTSCDLDLYARAYPSAETLSFLVNETKEGIYYKDFRQSPQSTNGFETIEFLDAIDLRALQIAVNFYAGESQSGVQGELRLSIEGETYAQAFFIDAVSGNKGAGIFAALDRNRSDISQTLLFSAVNIVSH